MLIHSAYDLIRARPERPKFTLAFVPAPPRAGHPMRNIIRRAGGRIVTNPHKADAVFFLPGKTAATALHRPNPLVPGFNFLCGNTSDAHVATTFRDVFGYDVAMDPASFKGEVVARSEPEKNSTKRIKIAPLKPEKHQIYQRLIDNEMQAGFVVEFLCPAIKGEIPLVYVKVRPKSQRFTGPESRVALTRPADVFTQDELAKISQVCSELSLDWGELSILRDKTDGRVYIVSANTAMRPPPAALPRKDKLRAVDYLAAALHEAVLETPGLIARHVPANNDAEAVRPDIIARVGS